MPSVVIRDAIGEAVVGHAAPEFDRPLRTAVMPVHCVPPDCSNDGSVHCAPTIRRNRHGRDRRILEEVGGEREEGDLSAVSEIELRVSVKAPLRAWCVSVGGGRRDKTRRAHRGGDGAEQATPCIYEPRRGRRIHNRESCQPCGPREHEIACERSPESCGLTPHGSRATAVSCQAPSPSSAKFCW
jgi:hypothetical protein